MVRAYPVAGGATGETTSGTLADSLPSIIADARIVREYEGTWQRTTDVRKLKDGTGLNWQEISLAQLTSQDISETTNNENAQQVQDTLLSVEPTMTQILIKVTDRTYRKIADVVESKMGTLAGNAMARKKDDDYLALFSTFATTVQPGAGVAFAYGYISAAKNRISSNATEPSIGAIYSVLHGFQIKDIQDAITSGVGTFAVPHGMTEDTFRQGFAGTVTGVNVFEDGNITIDGSADARGATHAREGVVAVMGMSIKTETRRDPAFGGGADEIFMTDEYAFVERSASNWAFGHLSDATAPTS
ncbi:hypothetical protein LCGC14_1715450 [marine sediment metagenome]|uniref:Major capsid protein n=1 Tax=marine sediment metagenome TaxID=412755 RepID=A0A0F9KE21_9ZZZZ